MFWTGELIAHNAPVRRRTAPPPWVSPLLGKATAAYLGLAIGDALGATVEFLTPNEIRHQIGVHRDITGGGREGECCTCLTKIVSGGENLAPPSILEDQVLKDNMAPRGHRLACQAQIIGGEIVVKPA